MSIIKRILVRSLVMSQCKLHNYIAKSTKNSYKLGILQLSFQCRCLGLVQCINSLLCTVHRHTALLLFIQLTGTNMRLSVSCRHQRLAGDNLTYNTIQLTISVFWQWSSVAEMGTFTECINNTLSNTANKAHNSHSASVLQATNRGDMVTDNKSSQKCVFSEIIRFYLLIYWKPTLYTIYIY